MDYLQIFDDNKNMIDEKIERNKKLTLNNGKHFMIVLLFVKNSEGKFLIQKTSISKKSVYATTGGHVTYKDDSLKTVIKETREELGIDISKENIEFVNTVKYPNCYCDIYYLNKDIDINTLILQDEEVESVNFFTKEEIQDLIKKELFRKSNIIPFNLLIEYLNNPM